MRIQQWDHCWCHNSLSNVLHLSVTFPVYASFGQQRRLISGMIFAREKTSIYKPCTNELELFFGTLSWSTIHVELFWVTFDPSVATLSINTLWHRLANASPIPKLFCYAILLNADWSGPTGKCAIWLSDHALDPKFCPLASRANRAHSICMQQNGTQKLIEGVIIGMLVSVLQTRYWQLDVLFWSS